MVRRAERAVRDDPDGDGEPEVETDHDRRKAWWYFLAYGLTAVGLAVGAHYTSGAPSVFLAVLAGFFATVTLWSVLFMGIIEHVVSLAKREPGHDRP